MIYFKTMPFGRHIIYSKCYHEQVFTSWLHAGMGLLNDDMRICMEILFVNGGRHSFEAKNEEELFAAADEYLIGINEENMPAVSNFLHDRIK